jgi:hypothetical protein
MTLDDFSICKSKTVPWEVSSSMDGRLVRVSIPTKGGMGRVLMVGRLAWVRRGVVGGIRRVRRRRRAILWICRRVGDIILCFGCMKIECRNEWNGYFDISMNR